ncbi:MAG: serine protease [Nitrospinae bacterium]|nr:serine protease [Nitrospinota bacterium]
MRATSILHATVFIAVIILLPSPVLGTSAKDVFSKVFTSVVVVLAMDKRGDTIAQGSGVVVGEYEVVTNCHVLEKAKNLMVRQASDWSGGKGYRMSAFLLARNDERDLCLLFVGELPIPPVARPARLGAAKKLSIGEEVYAVGAPAGLELSLSRGVVSQLRGVFGKRFAPLLQTDAAISPGSSGGGLFNQAGELVGITTFKWRGENLNFAIPSEWVKQLQTQGRVKLIKAKGRATCTTKPTYECVMGLALHAANSEEFFPIRAKRLQDIAAVQMEIGDIQGAQQTLAAATRAASSRDVFIGTLSDIETFANIFIAQTKIGDLQAADQTAMALTKAVNASSFHSRAKAYLASAQAKTARISNAIQLASRIKGTPRSRALADIAQAQAESGDIATAMETAMSIGDDSHRNRALLMVSDAQARVGNFEDARITVREIGDAAGRQAGFLRIAGWQLVAGHIEAAERTMILVSASGLFDGWFHMLLSTIQAKKGNFTAAITMADSLPRDQNGSAIRIALLNEIAVMQAGAGKALDAKRTLADALRIAHGRGDAKGRTVLLSTIAAAQSKAGYTEAAKQTFAQAIVAFENVREKFAYLRVEIAQMQAKAGFFEDAVKTALSIGGLLKVKYRVEALVTIARYLAGKPPPPFWDPRRSNF